MSALANLPKIAEMIQGLPPDRLDALLSGMGREEAAAMLDSWDLWKLPHQHMPAGNWRRWVAQWGRGAGKTYTGAKTTNEIARDRDKIRTGEIAIIGRTHSQTHRDLIEGPSGIIATAPHDFVPRWFPGKGTGLLIWPNGVRGHALSGDASETVLGVNASWVWADEVMSWPELDVAWWEHVELACRTGWARLMITSTPKPHQFLRDLVELENTVVTRASLYDNPLLAADARAAFEKVYKGTRRGAEQLEGEILDDLGGAMWRGDFLRVTSLPRLARVVVAVDPAVTSTDESDETGIVVVGLGEDGRGYVLQDDSGRWDVNEWPARVIALYRYWRADRVIAEVNNGGDMVGKVIRMVDENVSYSKVVATRGKVLRAEPVAALYEQEKVSHYGIHEHLEKQQISWIPGTTKKSPDRVDALVYGLTDLMIQDPSEGRSGPIDAYL